MERVAPWRVADLRLQGREAVPVFAAHLAVERVLPPQAVPCQVWEAGVIGRCVLGSEWVGVNDVEEVGRA